MYENFFNKIFSNYINDNNNRLLYKDLSYEDRKIYYRSCKNYLLCKILVNANNSIDIVLYSRDNIQFKFINNKYNLAYSRLNSFVKKRKIASTLIYTYNAKTYEELLLPVKENFTCAITLLDCEEGYKTNCNHIFEKNSIIKWLYDNDTCPLCRSKIN